MKCPYCKVQREKCVPTVVYHHAESYGGGVRNFHCLICHRVIEATVAVVIKISNAQKTNRASDW